MALENSVAYCCQPYHLSITSELSQLGLGLFLAKWLFWQEPQEQGKGPHQPRRLSSVYEIHFIGAEYVFMLLMRAGPDLTRRMFQGSNIPRNHHFRLQDLAMGQLTLED
jgi:hypothetical protein